MINVYLDAKDNYESAKNARGGGRQIQMLTGVGDEAFISGNTIHVLKGNRWINVQGISGKYTGKALHDPLTAVAKQAVDRLP